MLMEREEKCYVAERPRSKALFERAVKSLLGGVPMTWMKMWVGPFPIFVKEARGAHLTDVDGHRYLDLCLGDTGSMMGHSPLATADAIKKQAYQGISLMLPTEDSIWLGEELQRRFHLPYWQVYMTATDANRFAIKVAREITKRNLTLVFNGCYHGSVDEALVRLKDGKVYPKGGTMGPFPNPETVTKVIEFNDIDALDKALSSGDVACVLCEPAMTNVGIIYPETGYHTALRELTRRYGTLLILDETHTISAGPSGLTGNWNLEPDMFVLGKAIASAFPAAIMGISQKIAEELLTRTPLQLMMGFGGTLSGNALAVAAIRATLEHVMTEPAYKRMTALAEKLADGVSAIIKAADLPWHVSRIGCRVEYRYGLTSPKNGTEAKKNFDIELDWLLRLFFINRGILITPFHNMVLISPETTAEDVGFHNKVLGEYIKELVG